MTAVYAVDSKPQVDFEIVKRKGELTYGTLAVVYFDFGGVPFAATFSLG